MTGSRVRAGFLAVSLALTALLAVLLASQAQAATPEGAVISNGTVQLGVTELGSLNYDCAGNADTGCPDPSATEGVDEVGLRFVPLNIDSTSPGCLCEGWGIADATSGLTGFANEAAGDQNLTVEASPPRRRTGRSRPSWFPTRPCPGSRCKSLRTTSRRR